MPTRAALALSLAWLLALASLARGQAGLREEFEGPEPQLRYAGGDAPYRIDAQQAQGGAHGGQFCEFLHIQLGRGSSLYMALPISPAHVIAELAATVWVKADRAGPQLVGRIVLPNTIDPRTGTPSTLLVAGETYRDVGRWQPLRMSGLPTQMIREMRTLQSRLGPQVLIDPREAHLDQLALNVYTGPGGLRLWVDDLELVGAVAARPEMTPAPNDGLMTPARTASVNASTPQRPRIACQGSQLVVNDRPFFPRAVQYRGESLDYLKSLGFNAVALSRPPTAELLQESASVGMWLICPPPFASVSASGGRKSPDRVASFAPITALWDPVVAWDLGEGYTAAQFDDFCGWAKALRQADRGYQGFSRPVMCDVLTDCRAFSRHADILRPSRRPLGSTQELADYVTWLRERPRLARPGTPLWTVIQTQAAPEYIEQVRRLMPGFTPPTNVSFEQVRLMTCAALSAGVRGLVFESFSRLDAQDAEARRRAMILELMNMDLALAEPWGAAGSLTATVPGSMAVHDPAAAHGSLSATVRSSVPNVQGALLQTDKARLLVPLWLARGAQFVTGQSAANNVSFVVPGVPANHEVYEVSPCGMKRLEHQRVTGGIRVTLQEFGLTSLVLFSDDALVLRAISDRVGRMSQRAAHLHYELAVARLLQVEQLQQQLATVSPPFQGGGAERHLTGARAMLQQAEAALRRGSHDEAYRLTQRGLRPVLIVERGHWEQAQAGASPITSPFTVQADTLPQHWSFARRLQAAQIGANQLPAGDCEDVGRMRSAGWRLSQHPVAGVVTSADVMPGNPHSGNFSLRLSALPADPNAPPELLETPPIWLSTPPLAVPAGSLVRIHGYVRVPAPITSSVDGLLIYDSLSGPALAERLDATTGWQEFTLFRAAGTNSRVSELTVTFALSGLGEAWLDDVSIEPMLAPNGAR